jgi:spore germination protein KB
MMSKNAIRISELVASFALFEIGSTTLFLMGAQAKQDAWLAMLIGACGGFVLLLMYLWIFRLDSRRDLFELCLHYLGKLPGSVMGLLFTSYFAYEASRNARDLAELTSITLLDRTPLFVILLVPVLLAVNSARYGPKNVFLAFLSLLSVIVLGYGLLVLTIPLTGNVHPEYILPMLENGLLPVWKAAFPEIISFPFGQIVLFLVFFKLLHTDRKKLNKAVVLTYGIVALFLIAMNQLIILVLGPKLAELFTYPLLQVVRLIQVARVFERLDPLFLFVLYVGLGTKIHLFLMGASIGLYRITVLKYRAATVILGLIIYGLTFLNPVYTEFIWIGLHVTVTWIWPVFQFVLPALLLITMLIRKKKRQQQPDEASLSKTEKA